MTLRRICNDATPGYEVWVAEGTYIPSIVGDASFTLKEDGAIYGGFVGTESLRSQRDFENHPSILSGDALANDGDNFAGMDENRCHVVYGADNALIDGFIISGGNCISSGSSGGGMYNPNGDVPIVRNCTFERNIATSGGAISGVADVLNCKFLNNYASSSGGAYYAPQSTGSSISGSDFIGNVAEEYFGGAIYTGPQALKVERCNFSQNEAPQGGAVYMVVQGHIKTSTFSNNSATEEGGAIYLRATGMANIPFFYIYNSSFKGNIATERGGAVMASSYDDYGSTGEGIAISFVNCLFNNNSASRGGGLYFHHYAAEEETANLEILHSTIVDNNAENGGSNLYINWSTNSNAGSRAYNISRNIIWSSANDDDSHFTINSPESGQMYIIYNYIKGGCEALDLTLVNCSNVYETNPMLDPDGFDLQEGSPCIDRLSSLSQDYLDLDEDEDTSEDVPFDLAGNPRQVGDASDYGAFEYQQ